MGGFWVGRPDGEGWELGREKRKGMVSPFCKHIAATGNFSAELVLALFMHDQLSYK